MAYRDRCRPDVGPSPKEEFEAAQRRARARGGALLLLGARATTAAAAAFLVSLVLLLFAVDCAMERFSAHVHYDVATLVVVVIVGVAFLPAWLVYRLAGGSHRERLKKAEQAHYDGDP